MEKVKELLSVESTIGSTTLVTLYVSYSPNALWLARDHMAKEIKTATNIKNKQVGKNVGLALKMILHKLQSLKTIPVNGLVLCSGDFTTEGKTGSYL